MKDKKKCENLCVEMSEDNERSQHIHAYVIFRESVSGKKEVHRICLDRETAEAFVIEGNKMHFPIHYSFSGPYSTIDRYNVVNQ